MENELMALSNGFAGIVERVAPAVVAVDGRDRVSSSGFWWSRGAVVTASHTITKTEDIHIVLADGRKVSAALAGRDSGTDIAVLKADIPDITRPEGAAAVPRAGQIALVTARGTESGVNASMGVISAVSEGWRTWRGGFVDHYIRLDATVYPGSSGGAVVDAGGKLIGMATRGLSRLAGVAVPLSTLERTVEEILRHGHVARGYLGVGLQPVQIPEHLREGLASGQTAGLIALNVERGGPADEAGALIGDIFIAIDGSPVTDTDDVQAALHAQSIGRTIRVSILRGGKKRELAVAVRERPGRSS